MKNRSNVGSIPVEGDMAHGLVASISRQGNCYDSAVAESSFSPVGFGRLKVEAR